MLVINYCVVERLDRVTLYYIIISIFSTPFDDNRLLMNIIFNISVCNNIVVILFIQIFVKSLLEFGMIVANCVVNVP